MQQAASGEALNLSGFHTLGFRALPSYKLTLEEVLRDEYHLILSCASLF